MVLTDITSRVVNTSQPQVRPQPRLPISTRSQRAATTEKHASRQGRNNQTLPRKASDTAQKQNTSRTATRTDSTRRPASMSPQKQAQHKPHIKRSARSMNSLLSPGDKNLTFPDKLAIRKASSSNKAALISEQGQGATCSDDILPPQSASASSPLVAAPQQVTAARKSDSVVGTQEQLLPFVERYPKIGPQVDRLQSQVKNQVGIMEASKYAGSETTVVGSREAKENLDPLTVSYHAWLKSPHSTIMSASAAALEKSASPTNEKPPSSHVMSLRARLSTGSLVMGSSGKIQVMSDTTNNRHASSVESPDLVKDLTEVGSDCVDRREQSDVKLAHELDLKPNLKNKVVQRQTRDRICDLQGPMSDVVDEYHAQSTDYNVQPKTKHQDPVRNLRDRRVSFSQSTNEIEESDHMFDGVASRPILKISSSAEKLIMGNAAPRRTERQISRRRSALGLKDLDRAITTNAVSRSSRNSMLLSKPPIGNKLSSFSHDKESVDDDSIHAALRQLSQHSTMKGNTGSTTGNCEQDTRSVIGLAEGLSFKLPQAQIVGCGERSLNIHAQASLDESTDRGREPHSRPFKSEITGHSPSKLTTKERVTQGIRKSTPDPGRFDNHYDKLPSSKPHSPISERLEQLARPKSGHVTRSTQAPMKGSAMSVSSKSKRDSTAKISVRSQKSVNFSLAKSRSALKTFFHMRAGTDNNPSNVDCEDLSRRDTFDARRISRKSSRGSQAHEPQNPSAITTIVMDSTEILDAAQLAMVILNAARDEKRAKRKQELLKLGSILVAVVTSAREAESAVEEAKIVYKKAELASAECAGAVDDCIKLVQSITKQKE